ncbi:MAG: hypothetical protein U0269_20300 [Polyangiales bacterium]
MLATASTPACGSSVEASLHDAASDSAHRDASDAAAVDAASLRPLSTVYIINAGRTFVSAQLHGRDSLPVEQRREFGPCFAPRSSGARFVNGGAMTITVDDRSAAVPFGTPRADEYFLDAAGAIRPQATPRITLEGNDAFPAFSLEFQPLPAPPTSSLPAEIPVDRARPLLVQWLDDGSADELVVFLVGSQCGADTERHVECRLPLSTSFVRVPTEALAYIFECSTQRMLGLTRVRYAPVMLVGDAPIRAAVAGARAAATLL